jgi:hypothetical protein
VFDKVNENDGPSANAVMLEELKALLTDMLEHGEGNGFFSLVRVGAVNLV